MRPELQQVWQRVFREMDIWEHDDGQGSAYPVFLAIWQAANAATGARAATRIEREVCWKRWVAAGPALTVEREIELLRHAQGRAKDGVLFGGFPHGYPQATPPRDREPGEDG
jgi:hypothetical protein